jgi:nicotinamide-nucleotide amidase
MSKVNDLVKDLQGKKLKLALAESMTCGLAAHKLSTAKGVSEVLAGSIVCYSPEVKCTLLHVKKSLVDKYTAESMQVTEALARNLSTMIDADIHAAVTGLASKGGTETKEKPVGTVFICIYFKRKMHKVRKVFRGSPSEIKIKACEEIYTTILSIVK